MKLADVQVYINGDCNRVAEVIIDGRHYEDKVKSIEYHHEAGEIPTLTVEFYTDNVDIIGKCYVEGDE